MGMTMTQKILAKAAGLDRVNAGQLIEGKLDLVLGNDITTPVAITEFRKAGLSEVFDRNKIAIVLDHSTPCKDIKSAQLCAVCREFASEHRIKHFYDVGKMGVEHALIPEKGLAAPGEVIIGAVKAFFSPAIDLSLYPSNGWSFIVLPFLKMRVLQTIRCKTRGMRY